ncbi:MAG TPA: serine hydrolase [Pyrinomonadaceae bacterium]
MLKQSLHLIALISFVFGLTTAGTMAQQNTAQPTDETINKVDGYLSQWDKKDMPGVAVGIIKDGKLVYKRGLGMANLDHDIPNTPTTLFTVASVSKAFTAACVVLLSQQGKLSLDDDIRKYVPEMPQYGDTITIRHLLHHTSGIREYQALVRFAGLGTDNVYDEKFILKLMARQKNVSFKPGEKYQYSNSNYQLLGMIVARVSGKSLRAFADENIFKPLGMKNTMFADDRFEIVKNRAHGYMVGPDKSVRARSSLFDLVGGGGLMTTVEDLYLWDQNFYDPKVGGREMISLLTTPATLNSGEKSTYAFGMWSSKYKGLKKVTHSGNMPGFRAQHVSFPDQRFSVIVLSNNSTIIPPTVVEKIAGIYLEGQFTDNAEKPKVDIASMLPGIPIAEEDAARYAGIFTNHDLGLTFRMNMKDGKLVHTGLAKGELPVMRTADGRLVMVEGESRYEMIPVTDKSGAVWQMKLPKSNGQADMFVRVKAASDSPERLTEYFGTYYGEEFDANYTIAPKGKGFTLHIGDFGFEVPITPAYEDVFTTANGQIRLVFTRDDKGKITGFVFNSALDEREVKGVVFKRTT